MSLFSRSRRGSSNQQPSKSKPMLMLVDDEEFNLVTLAAMLGDDFNVIQARSGVEALDMLSDPKTRQELDVIICDQRMPVMTGVEFLKQTLSIVPDVRRIMVTGYTDVEAIVDAINDAQIFKYIKKPIDSNELRLTLTRALEAKRLETENRRLVTELQQALERISVLDADKLAFLRYLSHEMNTPLNWIGAAQVIDRESLAAEDKNMLGFVEQGQQRLRDLIAVVLHYFELAASEKSRPQESVDVALLLGQVLNHTLQQHEGKHIILSRQVPDTLTISAEAPLLKELLASVVENAITHAGSHGQPPRVDITLSLDGDRVLLEIHENGDGLNPEDLERIFKPFQSMGSQHSNNGFGMSLATARVIATRLGGNLLIRSPGKGHGTQTLLTLPLKPA